MTVKYTHEEYFDMLLILCTETVWYWYWYCYRYWYWYWHPYLTTPGH